MTLCRHTAHKLIHVSLGLPPPSPTRAPRPTASSTWTSIFAATPSLSRAQEAAGDRSAGCRIRIRVVEHDERPVAAHLEQQSLVGRAPRDPQAGPGRPDEPHGRDLAVAHELVAHDDARTQTKLNTPCGRSASATHRASSPEHIAVLNAGVQATVLPAASAGATISAGIVYGQFHGVTTATGPTGRRISSTRLPGAALGGIAPSRRTPSCAAACQIAISSST